MGTEFPASSGVGGGEEVNVGRWRGVEGRRLYLTLHCHLQNDFCVKLRCDVSHFNVSLTVRRKNVGLRCEPF